jgi:hypothetical protein
MLPETRTITRATTETPRIIYTPTPYANVMKRIIRHANLMCHPFNRNTILVRTHLKLARIPCNTMRNTKRLSSSTTPHQYFIHHTGNDPVAGPAKVVTGQACLSTRLARQAPAGVQSVPYVNAPFDSVRRVHLFCVFARARLFLCVTSYNIVRIPLLTSRHRRAILKVMNNSQQVD